MANEYLDPEFWLSRLIQRLMNRQNRYQVNEDYAIGNHPVPNGDPRYVKALRDLQSKATTNYVGLANKAVTDIRVKGFKFGEGESDPRAAEFWQANNMSINSAVAIRKACDLSDVYGIVSPPREEGGLPIISIEDPRTCIVEPDPLDPLRGIVGLKFYDDFVLGHTVAVLMFPEVIYVYHGPTNRDWMSRDSDISPADIVSSSGGFTLVEAYDNTLGVLPMIRGNWQPEYGVPGMAECEDGGYAIQDRINLVILQRLVISNSQAYRQRWATGVNNPNAAGKKGKPGGPKSSPFDPGADLIWAVADPDTKFGDFDQADLKQLLEAARDDVGDFAAITRTPVTYLTNKMVNVSGDTLAATAVAHTAKKRTRMAAMGWFFEELIKLCFLYENDSRATDVTAETLWDNPEQHTMAEIGDYVGKMVAAGVPLNLVLERTGFSPEDVKFALEEAEKAKQEEEAKAQQAVADQIMMANATKPDSNSSGGKASK